MRAGPGAAGLFWLWAAVADRGRGDDPDLGFDPAPPSLAAGSGLASADAGRASPGSGHAPAGSGRAPAGCGRASAGEMLPVR